MPSSVRRPCECPDRAAGKNKSAAPSPAADGRAHQARCARPGRGGLAGERPPTKARSWASARPRCRCSHRSTDRPRRRISVAAHRTDHQRLSSELENVRDRARDGAAAGDGGEVSNRQGLLTHAAVVPPRHRDAAAQRVLRWGKRNSLFSLETVNYHESFVHPDGRVNCAETDPAAPALATAAAQAFSSPTPHPFRRYSFFICPLTDAPKSGRAMIEERRTARTPFCAGDIDPNI